MREKIKHTDTVSRLVFHPKDYLDGGFGRLDLTMSFNFTTESQRTESVNCHRLIKDTKNKHSFLHELGRKKADRDTSKNPQRPRAYKGFAPAQVTDIRHKATTPALQFDVLHEPIDGNYAHCNIKMIEKTSCEKSERKTAIRRLADCFSSFVLYS